MRLQVFLSHAGVCSRRKAMTLVQSGMVSVNGRIITEPSFEVTDGRDHICVKERPVEEQKTVYILMNKPAGYVTTVADPHAEKTVMDLLPPRFRFVKPVGRLDRDTEGLLLLTNDGDVAYRLTHPRFNVEKTYYVEIQGSLTPSDRQRLEKGIFIEGKKTAPAKVSDVRGVKEHTAFYLTIHEGRKRQIRLMLKGCGHPVTFLQRIIQGPLELKDLSLGQWRFLDDQEIGSLKAYCRR